MLPAQRFGKTPSHGFDDANDLLRLAAELLEYNGALPFVDVHGARISHWNGQKITVARSDIGELIDHGLLDGEGRWTVYGQICLRDGAKRYSKSP